MLKGSEHFVSIILEDGHVSHIVMYLTHHLKIYQMTFLFHLFIYLLIFFFLENKVARQMIHNVRLYFWENNENVTCCCSYHCWLNP